MTGENIRAAAAVLGILGWVLVANGCSTAPQLDVKCQLDALRELPRPLDTTSVRDAIELVSRLRACEAPADAGQ